MSKSIDVEIDVQQPSQGWGTTRPVFNSAKLIITLTGPDWTSEARIDIRELVDAYKLEERMLDIDDE